MLLCQQLLSFCLFLSRYIIFRRLFKIHIFSLFGLSCKSIFQLISFSLVKCIIFLTELWSHFFVLLKSFISSVLVDVINIGCFYALFLKLSNSLLILKFFHFLSNCHLSYLLFLNFLSFIKCIFLYVNFILFMLCIVFHYDSVPLSFSWI